MQRNCLVTLVFSILVVIVGFACESRSVAAEETEILKITVGQPTKLRPERFQNTASVAVSRTRTVAAFYQKPGTGPKFYRVSKDAGQTWGPEMMNPPGLMSQMSGSLAEGGALCMLGEAAPVAGGGPGQLQAKRIVFSDDFLKHTVGTSAVSLPKTVKRNPWGNAWPHFVKGKIVQLANGDLLATMHGWLEGDIQFRTMIVRSSDQGRTWQYRASVAYSANAPDPQLPGQYAGYCEPSLALLSNGQLLCIMRTQGAQYAGEYRPLYVCWSDDLGKTWTKPVATNPHLMSISPTLAVLDNGVVACQYGRPGFHVAFSLDHGHTWQDRIRFSDLPIPIITGQFDMVKVGPNKLVAIGNDADGTKVWPIAVERVKVSQIHVALEGRVLNQQGNPIADAIVERSPNRYYLDSWLEHETALDPWKATPMTIGSPVLGYRSMQKQHGHPAVQTDAQGRFQFESVKLGEYVLTVEADGYAPQHRHIKVGPESKPQDFGLKPGRKVCNRVVDNTRRPVPGGCVVLNRWHTHTDLHGFFHWSVEAPLPEQVEIRVYKRHSGQYETLKTTLSFSQIERRPIILPRKR